MKRLIPRKFERRRLLGKAALRLLPDGATLMAVVLDLGQSGAALFTARGLPKGQLLEISFELSGPTARVGRETRDGYVVRSRAHSEGNVVGIAFVRPFKLEDLKSMEARWVRS